MKMDTFTIFRAFCLVSMPYQPILSADLFLTNFQIQTDLTIQEEFTYDEDYAADLVHCVSYCLKNRSCMSASCDGIDRTCHVSLYRFNDTSDDRLNSRSSSVVLTREGCPEGWIQLGDRCYLFREQISKLAPAQEFCGQYGAIIAEPQTNSTYQLIKNYLINVIGNDRFWIGVTIEEHDGNFTYVWSSTGVTTAYTDWDGTEMDRILARNSNRCVAIDEGYKWIPVGCSTNKNAICEK